MEPGKWKQALGGLLQKEKAVKLVVLLGICGIALIGLSSWRPLSRSSAAYRLRPLSEKVTTTVGWASPVMAVTMRQRLSSSSPR